MDNSLFGASRRPSGSEDRRADIGRCGARYNHDDHPAYHTERVSGMRTSQTSGRPAATRIRKLLLEGANAECSSIESRLRWDICATSGALVFAAT
jgi:hypothetical protein